MPTTESAFNKLFDIEEDAVGRATVFASRKVEYLYDWWLSSGGGDKLPLRAMFDITDHRPIVANIFLTEVGPGSDFTFRLMGEQVIQIIGRNNTGKVLPPGEPGEYGHALHAYYTSIVDQKVCKRCVGSLLFAGKEFKRFESIDCPLSNDGETVSVIIGVMDLIK